MGVRQKSISVRFVAASQCLLGFQLTARLSVLFFIFLLLPYGGVYRYFFLFLFCWVKRCGR
jgi:hypothetical protein